MQLTESCSRLIDFFVPAKPIEVYSSLQGSKFDPPSKDRSLFLPRRIKVYSSLQGPKFIPPSQAESRGATGLPHSIHHVTPAWEGGTSLANFLGEQQELVRRKETLDRI